MICGVVSARLTNGLVPAGVRNTMPVLISMSNSVPLSFKSRSIAGSSLAI